MFKEIVDDARRTPDIARSQKLTMSTLCSGELQSNSTHYQKTNFRFFQTERVADNNFKFDKNGRKLSKWDENTVGKGRIARNEQFFLLPQCFQKACFPGASKCVIVWEWVKCIPHNPDHEQPFRNKAFGNTVRTGERPGNEHSLFFPHFFYSMKRNNNFIKI